MFGSHPLAARTMKSVSCGLILWKTTFCMDDFPARRAPMSRMRGVVAASFEAEDADAIGPAALWVSRGGARCDAPRATRAPPAPMAPRHRIHRP